MKRLSKVFLLAALLISTFTNIAKAQSTVYFFVDFRFWNSEYVFSVNGKPAFTLTGEGKPLSKGSDVMMYNMMARKVTFKKSGSYVVSIDCPSARGTYHAELNLNLEDGETYYVLINSNMKKNFYAENLDEKAGQKLLKKAQSSKKYTFNEDFVYEK